MGYLCVGCFFDFFTHTQRCISTGLTSFHEKISHTFFFSHAEINFLLVSHHLKQPANICCCLHHVHTVQRFSTLFLHKHPLFVPFCTISSSVWTEAITKMICFLDCRRIYPRVKKKVKATWKNLTVVSVCMLRVVSVYVSFYQWLLIHIRSLPKHTMTW